MVQQQKHGGESAAPAPFRVWEAGTWNGNAVGYLVTGPGGIDDVLAFVFGDGSEDDEDADGRHEQRDAKHAAYKIAEDPSWAWRCCSAPIVDLTPFGKLDSIGPMPAFIYGLWCRPMPPELDPDNAKESLDVPPVEPRPYCRFLMAALVEQHNRMAFSDAARRELPYATVGIHEHEDGQGANLTRLLCASPRVPVGPETFDVLARLSAATGEPVDEVIAYMVSDLEAGVVWDKGAAALKAPAATPNGTNPRRRGKGAAHA